MISLYPYQIPHAGHLLQTVLEKRVALDTSDTGTGKTYSASHIAALLSEHPVVVVCPKPVMPVWLKVLRLAEANVLLIVNYELLTRGNTRVMIKGPGKKRFTWTVPDDTLIIWDEGHRCQGENSLNACALRDAKHLRNLVLSATLAESPKQMRAVGYLTNQHSWTNWYGWCLRNGCYKNPWNGLEFSKTKGPAVMTRLNAALFPAYGGGIRIADLGDAFPETLITADAYAMDDSDEMQEIYEEMEQRAQEILASGDENAMANVLVERLRARQAVELLKVPGLVSMARDAVDEGMSVVIFTNFVETLERLCEHLGTTCAVHGSQSAEQRQSAIEAFQADEERIIIVNIQAGGVGLSLHDLNGKYPRLSLVCPTDNAKLLRQALGRVHRAGGLTKSVQRIVFAAGTIEEGTCKEVSLKLANLDRLNDGDLEIGAPAKKDLNETETCVSIPPRNSCMTESNVPAPPAPPIATPGVIGVETRPAQAGPGEGQAERAHAKHSPSSLKNKATCPGWRGESGTNKWAERGTLGHEAVEKRNPDLCVTDPFLKRAVERCIAHVASIPGKHIQEQRLAILDQFGYVDLVVLDKQKATIVDYKFTQNRYYADSPQFWAYAIGVWDKWPDAQAVEVRVLHPELDIIDVETWTRTKDYDRLVAAVKAIIEAAEKEDPDTFAVGAVCTYCDRAKDCPALAKVAVEITRKYAEPVDPAFPKDSDFHGSHISDPAAIASLLRMAPILAKAIDGWKKAAMDMRMQGTNIPGYDLVDFAGRREITNPRLAFDLFVEKGGKPEDFINAVDVRIGDFENIFANLAPRGKKGAWKAEASELLIARDALSAGAPSRQLRAVRSK